MIHIIHNIPRPDGALVERFSRHGSATVHEAMGRLGAMSWKIKPLARGMKVCGPAFTVQVQAGDNVMILRAIRDARPGDVLVVDCGRCPESGPFGELAATECQVQGLGGFVTTGSVRDSAEIISMGFPVFSGGVSIVGTVKESLGLRADQRKAIITLKILFPDRITVWRNLRQRDVTMTPPTPFLDRTTV